jgi:hypothetical protein
MEQTAQQRLRVPRIVAGACAAGVTVVWVVGWILTAGGRAGLAGSAALPAEFGLGIWAATALAGVAGALFLRSRTVQLRAGARDAGVPALSDESLVRAQAGLIVAAALLEGPALVSGIFFLLIGARLILWAGVAVYLVGLVMTYPRAEWFGVE